jgi:hypothetical protein
MAFDPDLEAFVRAHFHSIWSLELLLLLRAGPDRTWSPDEVVKEMRASPGMIAHLLEHLHRAGLLMEEEGRFRYSPATSILDEACGGLEAAYRKRPVAMTNLIAQPSDNVQAFADAFRIRRQEDK